MEIHVVCVICARAVDSEGRPTGIVMPHITRGVFTDLKKAQNYAISEGGFVTTLMLDDPVKLASVKCEDRSNA
jgi:hypothetical protein